MKSKPKGANCLKTFTGKAKHIKLKRSIIIIDEIESRRQGRYEEVGGGGGGGGGGGEIRRNDFPISACYCSVVRSNDPPLALRARSQLVSLLSLRRSHYGSWPKKSPRRRQLAT